MYISHEQERIESLRIGDTVYQYRGNIGVPQEKDFLCYYFYKITGETKCYWILSNGYGKARKSDLKEYNGSYCFSKFSTMDERAIKMKKLKDDYSQKVKKANVGVKA